MSEITPIITKTRNLALDVYEVRTKCVARGEEGVMCDLLLEVHDDLIQTISRLESLGSSTTVSWHGEVESPVATKLRKLLDDAHMSVSALAETAGVSRTTINNILDGDTAKPQRKTLTKIEEVFGLKEGALDG